MSDKPKRGCRAYLGWDLKEIEFLKEIATTCSPTEVYEIYKRIGSSRTDMSIRSKCSHLNFRCDELGKPDRTKIDPQWHGTIEDILKEREARLSLMCPMEILTDSQRGTISNKVQKAQKSLMVELQEVRDSIPRRGSISLKRAKGDKQSLCVVLSDFHIGRTITSPNNEEIYGVNIGIDRICQTSQKVAEILRSMGSNSFDEGVVLLLGDHIDGEGIFPGQEMMLETHVSEQVKRVTRAMWRVIKDTRKMFPLLRVVTVRGNHGRTQASAEANWDNMFFQQLELLIDMEEDDGLTIKNRYGEFNSVEVKGWKGIIRHRAPGGAETPSAIARYAGWHGIHDWDFFIGAHWHHWGATTWNSKPIFRNGSLIGPDDYSEKLAVSDCPTQLAFGISETELPTFIYPMKY
jgi:hypothetical protein